MGNVPCHVAGSWDRCRCRRVHRGLDVPFAPSTTAKSVFLATAIGPSQPRKPDSRESMDGRILRALPDDRAGDRFPPFIAWSRPSTTTEPISWADPTILTTIFVWLAMVILLVRLLSSSQQSGKAVAQLSMLSGGFLLVTVLGPMLLAGSGNLNTFHGRSNSEPPEAVEAAEANVVEPGDSDSTIGSQEPQR